MKMLPPSARKDFEWPEQRKLVQMEKTPQAPQANTKYPKMYHHVFLYRGPELVHNFLIHKKYGIQAKGAGSLHYKHFEAMRVQINRKIDVDRMFAIWRVDPPWLSCCKRGPGHKMGGGKGKVHHHVTPVKQERIILELGGDIDECEARKLLEGCAEILPLHAEFVSQEILEERAAKKEKIKTMNMNRYTYEYVLKNNLGGANNWVSPYDYFWFNEYH